MFPESLTYATIMPIFKKEDETDKTNYLPTSVPQSISKILGKTLFAWIETHTNNNLSSLLCGLRQKYSTQYTLLNRLQKWQESLDARNLSSTTLIDLSKAYDALLHGLLLAKLKAYDFHTESLKLDQNFLSFQNEWVKMGVAISDFGLKFDQQFSKNLFWVLFFSRYF